MENKQKILIITGSPRKDISVSHIFASYVKNRAERTGADVRLENLYSLLESPDGNGRLIRLLDLSDHLMVAFPLYIDCLPWAVTKAFEDIFAQKNRLAAGKKSMSAIINCGFPEAEHNVVAADICRCFAFKAGMEWLGAAMVGAGHLANDEHLKPIRFITRRLRKAFDIITDDICSNKAISGEALELIKKPILPKWLYRIYMYVDTRQTLKKYGVYDHLHDKY